MKVLVLITLSYDQPIYSEHRDVWRSFMHAHPDVDSYFISSREDVKDTFIEGDIVWTPGPEGYSNGTPSGARLEKTLDALKHLIGNHYDFVVRTGLSSIWIYPNLIKFLSTLSTKNVYCGIDGGGFVSGAGIIMSHDIAAMLVDNYTLATSQPYEEDVRIASCFELLGVPITRGSRVDIVSLDHYKSCLIPVDTFHFRVKFHINNQNVRKDEVIVMRDILRRYSSIFNTVFVK